MPVSFLTPTQRDNYGRYTGSPTTAELTRYFHLDEVDLALIAQKRGDHNRLGFALQLSTLRFLGTFLEDISALPETVLQTLVKQLNVESSACLSDYQDNRQRRIHLAEIRALYGYREFTDRSVGFRLTRWLYALCWTGTERPSVLFDRAAAWMLSHKVLLPGASILERFIARLRSRVETRLWRLLGQNITVEQQTRLLNLLKVPEGSRKSQLDSLRRGPVMISGPALVRSITRLQTVRDLGIKLPATASIPPARLASLARYANTAKVTAVSRLPASRRLATLVALVHTLEATAQDDALEVLESLLQELFNNAKKADRIARLRTIKDLDQAASILAEACQLLLDPVHTDNELRKLIFENVPHETLAQALENGYNPTNVTKLS